MFIVMTEFGGVSQSYFSREYNRFEKQDVYYWLEPIPLSTLTERLEGEAVLFAEWILKSDWQMDGDAWVKRAGNYTHGIIEEVITTSQLFSKYKDSKKQG